MRGAAIAISMLAAGGLGGAGGRSAAAAPCVAAPVGTWVPVATAGAPTFPVDGGSWLGGKVWYLGDGAAAFDPCANTWTTYPSATSLGFDTNMFAYPIGAELVRIAGRTGRPTLEIVVGDAHGTRVVDTQVARSLVLGNSVVASTGHEVLVWGGAAEKKVGTDGGVTAEVLGTGVRIDPASTPPAIRPMNLTGAPSARALPLAIWTGSRLFVWGGYTKTGTPFGGCGPNDSCVLAADGALYDPATDRWTPIATAGAPSPRTGAIVALAGTRVVVFGGTTPAGAGPGQTALHDGAVYDPATNRWQPIASGEKVLGAYPSPMYVDPAGTRLVFANGAIVAVYDLAKRAWAKGPPQPADQGLPGITVVMPEPSYASLSQDGATTLVRLDLTRLRWQRAVLPKLSIPHDESGIAAGERIVVWSSEHREVDPTGDNGCTHTTHRPCDPVTPMKTVKQAVGAMIVPAWTDL